MRTRGAIYGNGRRGPLSAVCALRRPVDRSVLAFTLSADQRARWAAIAGPQPSRWGLLAVLVAAGAR